MIFSKKDRDDLLNYLLDNKRIFYKYLYTTDDDNRYYLEKKKDNKSYRIMKYNNITQRITSLVRSHYVSELHYNIDDIIETLKRYEIIKYIELRPLSLQDIQKFITDSTNYYRDIFDIDNNDKYYLYINHKENLIELNTINNRVEYTFKELHSIDPKTILDVLKSKDIAHTTNPDLTSNADTGGKRRSKSRIRRKRSQKRKKYKRRQHTYRKFKTKV